MMSFKLVSIVALGCVYSQHLRGSAPASDSLWGATAATADDDLWQLIPADLWADVNVQTATPRPTETIWDDAGTTAAALPPPPPPPPPPPHLQRRAGRAHPDPKCLRTRRR